MMQNEPFEQKIKASLDSNLQQLDFDTRQQLAFRRQQALAKGTNKWLQTNYWLPAGSLALCSLFAAIMIVNSSTNDSQPVNHDQLAVFELLDNAEELELMTDPDFYAWIDEALAEDEKIAS
jgi:hypothetical protein